MRVTAAIGQRWKRRWKRAMGATLTIVLLAAVLAGGISLVRSEVFAAWKVLDNGEQALASGDSFAGLLNFAAPAQTVTRAKAQAAEAEQNSQRARNAALLVKNWKYTQLPIADQLLQGLGQFLFAYETAVTNSINQVNQLVAADFSALASLINAILTAYGNLVTSFSQAIESLFLTQNITNVSNTSSSSTHASPFE